VTPTPMSTVAPVLRPHGVVLIAVDEAVGSRVVADPVDKITAEVARNVALTMLRGMKFIA